VNIAAFIWSRHPSASYRAVHPMSALARRGNLVAQYEIDGPPPSDEELATILEDFDVAFFGRFESQDERFEAQREALQTARRLSEGGLPVVWDYDDDVVRPARRVGFEAMAACTDVITTTNEALAERYRAIGAGTVVAIPNFLTRPSLSFPRRRHDGTVLGYIGWMDHQADWDELGLQEAVEDLLDVHDDLRVESAGPIDLGLPRERYHAYGTLGFDQLPQAIAGFDLAIAPLADRPGNATRSDIKLKEYAIAGVPWLASDYGPYAGYGEEQGGRLVADGAWFDALNDLLCDGKAQRKLSKRGQKWAKEQTLDGHAPLWLDALQQAVALAEERRAARAA
jgi:glycosyltransferase involved in cell wall biosynthesis